ncbi:MAG: DNA polymerase III subunit delta [Gemmatimonadetes bacterium]|nr:DNA polymerase III subunit delta [Gemmatimonadota bacterium]NIO31601.1 DNA polymerase III subunit delta [Gemmatimonadota bacterium]
MGELTYDQLSDRMERGELGGSFFLETEDPFLRDEAISLLTEAHLAGGSADFDLDQASGDDLDAASLAAMLGTPPMLSPYRVVVVRKAQGLTPKSRSVVEEAVRREVPNRVLILAAEVPRGSKAKFYDVLRRRCMTTALRAPGTSELPGWLARRARSVHGVELEMPAAQLLAAGIGARLGVLAQELEKLVSYVEPAKKIGLAEVRAAVGALPQVDRWSWIDKVAERRIASALEELPALLDSGESAVALIGWLSESLIRVGLARAGEGALVQVLKRDGSYGNLAWKVRTYVRQARHWSEVQIAAALAELLRADRLIKAGGLSERAALEEALLRIGAGDGSQRQQVAGVGGRGGRSRRI